MNECTSRTLSPLRVITLASEMIHNNDIVALLLSFVPNNKRLSTCMAVCRQWRRIIDRRNEAWGKSRKVVVHSSCV